MDIGIKVVRRPVRRGVEQEFERRSRSRRSSNPWRRSKISEARSNLPKSRNGVRRLTSP